MSTKDLAAIVSVLNCAKGGTDGAVTSRDLTDRDISQFGPHAITLDFQTPSD